MNKQKKTNLPQKNPGAVLRNFKSQIKPWDVQMGDRPPPWLGRASDSLEQNGLLWSLDIPSNPILQFPSRKHIFTRLSAIVTWNLSLLYGYFHQTGVMVHTNNKEQKSNYFCIYSRNFRASPPALQGASLPSLPKGLTLIPTFSKANEEVFRENSAMPSSFVV